ncbi:MAG: carbohydrate-binding protein [Cyclobacteriaceae bacterium]
MRITKLRKLMSGLALSFLVFGLAVVTSCSEDEAQKFELLKAAFTSDITSVTEKGTVNFSSETSEGGPDGWEWTFDGGTPPTSNAQNPAIVYNEAGTYLVALRVTREANNAGISVVDSTYITVVDGPVSNFEAVSATEINVGESVTFRNLSLSGSTLEWAFDGGSPATSTAAEVEVTYSEVGVYDVSLTSTLNGSSDTKTEEAMVTVTLPDMVADFTVDSESVIEGASVTFSDATTNGPDSWAWTFEGGDIETSTEQNPVVTYAVAGTYTVTLSATRASDMFNSSVEKVGFITVSAEPFAVPGVVQFKDWNAGGQGVGYNDTDANGPVVEGDEANPNIGFTSDGEWLEYTIDVAEAATYKVDFVTASNNANPGQVKLQTDDGVSDLSEQIDFPNTGGWQAYTTTSTTVVLPAGVQVIRFFQVRGGSNYRTMTFSKFELKVVCDEAANLVGCGGHANGETDILRWYAFENGAPETDKNSLLSVSTEQANEGNSSIKYTFVDANTTQHFVLNNVVFDVPSEASYKLDVDVFGDNLSGGTDWVMEISMRPSNDIADSETYKVWSRKAGGSWQTLSVTHTLPAGEYIVGFKVFTPGFTTDLTLDYYVDNIVVTKQ